MQTFCNLADVFKFRVSGLVCGEFMVKWKEIPPGVLLATDIPVDDSSTTISF